MKLEKSDLDELRMVVVEVVRQTLGETRGSGAGGAGRLAYSEAEVAAMLGLESYHIREQRRRGKIKFFRGPGRRVMYRAADVERYIANNTPSD